MGDQLTRVKTGVGHIAAPPAADAHFLKYFAAFFQDAYPTARQRLGKGNRPEKSGSPSAYNDGIPIFTAHSTGF
jgi:hypothetical protein